MPNALIESWNVIFHTSNSFRARERVKGFLVAHFGSEQAFKAYIATRGKKQ